MSDEIKHECGVTLLRLRRNTDYYVRKYGSPFYGYRKLALMLEKQHNRGQDGAGIACVRLDPEPGEPAYMLEKSCRQAPLPDLLERIGNEIRAAVPPDGATGTALEQALPFCGDIYLGHLRYGTFGRGGVANCHSFVHDSACLNRTLLLAGNFNLTDIADLFRALVRTGHHPASKSDGYLILQRIAHHLERRLDRNPRDFDLADIIECAAKDFDGAYTLCGMFADGNAFAVRDPAGIRPGFFYYDDEVAVVASERPAIQAAFDRTTAEVMELPPGHILTIDKKGNVDLRPCLPQKPIRRCVFERIYFSRPNDADIHRERKDLGRSLVPAILKQVNNDFDNTFFSYIPNTAQVSFHGMLEDLNRRAFESGKQVRFGQIAIKDAKFRTFIADAASRKDFYMHIYDVTYGLVRPGSDTLVVLDDSIVRGNTMRNAILPILNRLGPKKIVVAFAAPPLKYPDCYGIDMASLGELVAFDAVVMLLERAGKLDFLTVCYEEAKRQLDGPKEAITNCVKPIYDLFTESELAEAIAEKLRPEDFRGELNVVFQTCEDLVHCCPNHRGDWYFTGDYPTVGGFRVVNRALVNFVERREGRAY